MMIDELIVGDRIYLRNLSPEESLSHYVDWLNDPDINRYLEARFVSHTADGVADFVRRCNEANDNLLLGMMLRSEDRHVGNIKLGPINPHHCRGDVGLLIGDRSVWGHGIGPEAIRLLTAHALENLNLNKVCAGIYGVNQGSMRAFEKAGYVRSAHLGNHWKVGDGWTDHLVYEAVNGQWVAQ